jgi:hypothetical protein
MDVGVYTEPDLLGQPARPGTVRLAREHLLLYGDASVIERMAQQVGTHVLAEEGLYLLENRLRELAESPGAGDAAAARLERYRRVKTVLDCVTAVRIVAGRYDPSIPSDEAALEALDGFGALPRGWRADLVAEAAAGLSASTAGREPPDLDARAVEGLVVDVWLELAARVLGVPSNGFHVVLKRSGSGDYLLNFREFLALSSGRLGGRLRRAWAGARLCGYSPVRALRLEPMARAVHRSSDDLGGALDGLFSYLDRLTAAFGFHEGPLESRVSRLHRVTTGGH